MRTYILASALVAYAAASCPNGCNGHGSCGTSDVCMCYKGFFGGDCSYRHCPEGPSWTVVKASDLLDDRKSEEITLRTPGGYVSRNSEDDGAQYPLQAEDMKNAFMELYPKRPSYNPYTECSSRGTCDYATGECKCFDGFEGRGCRRTTCPNDCTGHGRCLTNEEVNTLYSTYSWANDQSWDQGRTQQCVCDRGYYGYDCSSRICPFGDDPTTDCGENSAGDQQLVVVEEVDDQTSSYFTLTFTDMFGGEFTTRPIMNAKCEVSGTSTDGTPDDLGQPCAEVQYALMDLPNFAVPEVEVDLVYDGTTTRAYLVSFTDPSTAGKQNTLQCNAQVASGASTNAPGSQPKYASGAGCVVYNVGIPEWYSASGDDQTLVIESNTKTKSQIVGSAGTSETTYEDFQPCSSKGDCDGSTGTCVCNSGHYGEACEKQSTYY